MRKTLLALAALVAFLGLAADTAAQTTPSCTCASLSPLFKWQVNMHPRAWLFGRGDPRVMQGSNRSGTFDIDDRYLEGTDAWTSSGRYASVDFEISRTLAKQLYENGCRARVVLEAFDTVTGALIKTETGGIIGECFGTPPHNFINHGETLSNAGLINPSWPTTGITINAYIEILRDGTTWVRCPGPVSTLTVT